LIDKKRVVIVGSNLAGYSAAMELLGLLPNGWEVLVISLDFQYVYTPSLVWVPFGKIKGKDIVFDCSEHYKSRQIRYLKDRVVSVDPANQTVHLPHISLSYEFLLLCTGAIPSIKSRKQLQEPGVFSISTLAQARLAKKAILDLCHTPGPCAIVLDKGAICVGAAYEFVFNLWHFFHKNAKLKNVDITFITYEDALFSSRKGLAALTKTLYSALFKTCGIKTLTKTRVRKIKDGMLYLSDGQEIPSSLTVLFPTLRGADIFRETSGLVDSERFVVANEFLQNPTYPTIFSAGIAIKAVSGYRKIVSYYTAKESYPSQKMGLLAAWNICRVLDGEAMQSVRSKSSGNYETKWSNPFEVGDHARNSLSVSRHNPEFIVKSPMLVLEKANHILKGLKLF
jgi:sulfide:quinone oxidoreductase